jgi:hypothetical protein
MNIKTLINSSLYFSDIVNGYLFEKVYFGYSKTDAKKLFKQEIKKQKQRGN